MNAREAFNRWWADQATQEIDGYSIGTPIPPVEYRILFAAGWNARDAEAQAKRRAEHVEVGHPPDCQCDRPRSS